MIFDSHMHSKFSFDSKMDFSHILEKKKDLNIGIILTDHVDLNLSFVPKINMTKLIEETKTFKNDSFLIGLEIGLFLENPDIILDFVNEETKDLDFILGSIHTINGADLYYSLKEDNRSKHTIYEEYLNTILENIKTFDFFDSLSHIDYICRYANFHDNELYLDEFKELFTKIFQILIEKNKVIELNTNRLENKKSFDALVDIYSYYKELGGKYITVGSDAHVKSQIGRNFDLLNDFITRTGLKIVYFKNRTMII